MVGLSSERPIAGLLSCSPSLTRRCKNVESWSGKCKTSGGHRCCSLMTGTPGHHTDLHCRINGRLYTIRIRCWQITHILCVNHFPVRDVYFQLQCHEGHIFCHFLISRGSRDLMVLAQDRSLCLVSGGPTFSIKKHMCRTGAALVATAWAKNLQTSTVFWSRNSAQKNHAACRSLLSLGTFLGNHRAGSPVARHDRGAAWIIPAAHVQQGKSRQQGRWTKHRRGGPGHAWGAATLQGVTQMTDDHR